MIEMDALYLPTKRIRKTKNENYFSKYILVVAPHTT